MRADDIVGKYRLPLTYERALSLAHLIEDYPNHELSVEPPFLVIREAWS